MNGNNPIEIIAALVIIAIGGIFAFLMLKVIFVLCAW